MASTALQHDATITCPECGVTLKPLDGDCCVFCSYANVPCLPVQKARNSAE